MTQTLAKIILPQKGSVLVVAPVLHFERFIHGPAKERKNETQSHISVHLSEFHYIEDFVRFDVASRPNFSDNKIFDN